jgi:hypothetical protein
VRRGLKAATAFEDAGRRMTKALSYRKHSPKSLFRYRSGNYYRLSRTFTHNGAFKLQRCRSTLSSIYIIHGSKSHLSDPPAPSQLGHISSSVFIESYATSIVAKELASVSTPRIWLCALVSQRLVHEISWKRYGVQ